MPSAFFFVWLEGLAFLLWFKSDFDFPSPPFYVLRMLECARGCRNSNKEKTCLFLDLPFPSLPSLSFLVVVVVVVVFVVVVVVVLVAATSLFVCFHSFRMLQMLSLNCYVVLMPLSLLSTILHSTSGHHVFPLHLV